MDATISHGVLTQGLQDVRSIVEKRNRIPILSTVLIEAAPPDQITLRSSNLEIHWRVPVAGAVHTTGSVALEADKLWRIIKALPKGVNVGIGDAGEGWVAIEANGAKFRLPLLLADDFPAFPQMGMDEWREVHSTILQGMIDRVYHAIATPEDGRGALEGALLVHEGEALRLTASNGHVLATVETSLVSKTESPLTVIIPRAAVKELCKLAGAKKRNSEGMVRFQWQSPNAIAFERDGKTFVTLGIDDRYPDYSVVMPKTFTREIVVDRQGLQAAVTQVCPLTHDRMKPIVFGLCNGMLNIGSNSPELGNAGCSLNVVGDGAHDLFEIGFNGGYVLGILGAIEAKQVRLQFTDPLGVTRIVPGEPRDYDEQYLLMPMRI